MPFKNAEDRKNWWKHRRDNIRKIIEDAKAQPCADCKNTFHFAAMQFDHVRGEKKFNIGAATAQSSSIKTLEDEIAKCDIVCANCHHIRTYERGYFNRHNEADTD